MDNSDGRRAEWCRRPHERTRGGSAIREKRMVDAVFGRYWPETARSIHKNAAPRHWGCSNFCRVSVLTALFQDQLTHHLTAGDRAAVRERACFFTENPATRKRIPVTRHCNHAADRQSDDARRRPLRVCHPPPSLPIRPAHDAVFRRAAARPRH